MDNSTTNHAVSSVTVRVDLTSQDLRTGTVRLPRQLRERFEAGPLTASTDEPDSQLNLEFAPPGDLTGLQGFLQQHELKTNDAIVLHVDGKEIRLEPFYRRPRAKPADSAGQEANQGLFAAVNLPIAQEAASFEEETEPADTLQLNPELQPGLFNDAAATSDEEIHGSAEQLLPEPETLPAGRLEAQPAAEAAAQAEPEPTARPPAVTWSAAEAEGSEFDAWADDDEHHLDELDAGLASFGVPREAEVAVNDLEQPDNGAAQAEAAQTEEHNDLPPLPAWQAPVQQQHPETAAAEDQPPEAQATLEHSAFHAVQRRPFTPRGPSLPATTRISRPAGLTQPAAQQEAGGPGAQAAASDSTPPVGQASSGSEPNREPPAGHTVEPAAADSPRQRIQKHLDSPDLPSILQAKQVAQELGIGEDEAADALLELSQLPDSRLSTVRPGFYLLKRDRHG